MKKIFIVSIMIISGLITCSYAAELYSDTYKPEYRTATELYQKIRPSTSPDTKLTIANGKIFIKSPREELTNIRNLLLELDKPVQTYTVTLSGKEGIEEGKSSYKVNGMVPINGYGKVSFTSSGDSSKYNKGTPEKQLPDNIKLLTEDEPKFIKYGKDSQVEIHRSIMDENGNKVKTEILYKLSSQGFYLTVKRIDANNLVLDISPFLGGQKGYLKQHMYKIMSSIYCVPGKWIKLNFTDVLFDKHYSEAIIPEDIWIKVDKT